MPKLEFTNLNQQLGRLFIDLCVEGLNETYDYAPGFDFAAYGRGRDSQWSGQGTKIDTGKLRDSIDMVFPDENTTEIVMEDYGLVVNFGRQPGTYVPITPLKEWASRKGMPEGAAYAISKNIQRYGIAPTNFIDDAIARLAEITLDPTNPRNPFNEEDVTEEVEDFINQIIEQITN